MARTSLRHVSRRAPNFRDLLGGMVDPGQRRDDRSAVIIGVAGLERGLERLLRAKFRRMRRADYQKLFEGTGPLATMSGKIQVGYALGLYGPKTRHDLEVFNEIRNVFAHAAHNITFKNKRLMDRASGLFALKYATDNEVGRDAFDVAIRHYFVPFALLRPDGFKKMSKGSGLGLP